MNAAALAARAAACDFLRRRPGFAVGDVLRHGRRQDDRLLQDQRHLTAQVLQAKLPQINPVQLNAPARRIEEPRQQQQQRRLARAARPDQAPPFPRVAAKR